MNNNLQVKIETNFPWLQTYIECNDGWYTLIHNLLTELESLYKNYNTDIKTLQIITIKEKYASLRVQVSQSLEDIVNKDAEILFEKVEEIIQKYEKISHFTCEKCAKDGNLCEKDKWYKVLCDECRVELNYEKVD